MRKSDVKAILVIIFLIFTVGIGYSYLTSELSITGDVLIRKYTPPIRYLYEEVVAQNLENGVRVLDNKASNYVTASTGIDFNLAPGVTNGQGLYIRNGTENDTNPIYYYRGDVLNNNVVFADYCWKIVRTTETGGIKLIYSGVPSSDGSCTVSEEPPFKNMYTYYDFIYDWYNENLSLYESSLEKTVWCFENVECDNEDYFCHIETEAMERLGTAGQVRPSFTCTGEYQYSSEEFIGLLSADEVTFAGNGYAGYGDTYLMSSYSWWTTTVIDDYASDTGDSFIYNQNQLVVWYTQDELGYRPSISLRGDTKILLNGDGSLSHPFVVDVG